MEEMKEVCCMCGDVGFPDKLFRCCRCLSRVQHSYCSGFYVEWPSEAAKLCDWCRCEDRAPASNHSSTRPPPPAKERDSVRAKPRLRRYKLLKDVLC